MSLVNLGFPLCGSQDWIMKNGCGGFGGFSGFSFNLRQKQQQHVQGYKISNRGIKICLSTNRGKRLINLSDYGLKIIHSFSHTDVLIIWNSLFCFFFFFFSSFFRQNERLGLVLQEQRKQQLAMFLLYGIHYFVVVVVFFFFSSFFRQNERLGLVLQEQRKQQLAQVLKKIK
jgi:hypothetical protein